MLVVGGEPVSLLGKTRKAAWAAPAPRTSSSNEGCREQPGWTLGRAPGEAEGHPTAHHALTHLPCPRVQPRRVVVARHRQQVDTPLGHKPLSSAARSARAVKAAGATIGTDPARDQVRLSALTARRVSSAILGGGGDAAPAEPRPSRIPAALFLLAAAPLPACRATTTTSNANQRPHQRR
jgi:hypothetical protein